MRRKATESPVVRERARCRRRKCEAMAFVNGLCCPHYIDTLEKFEDQSRKSKIVVGASPNDAGQRLAP